MQSLSIIVTAPTLVAGFTIAIRQAPIASVGEARATVVTVRVPLARLIALHERKFDGTNLGFVNERASGLDVLLHGCGSSDAGEDAQSEEQGERAESHFWSG